MRKIKENTWESGEKLAHTTELPLQTASRQTKQDTPQPDLTPKDKGLIRRTVALAIIVGIIVLLFLARLVQFQLIEGEKYYEQATRAAFNVSFYVILPLL